MNEAHARKVRFGARAGSGYAASGVAGFLRFAAAPVFALMAVWTGVFGDRDMFCVAMQGSPPLGGMTLMYLLMSVFHAAPWLRLIARW